ncbi:hypothetical protein HPP92_023884 [Vanilla planifolia]|uniref:Sister chromatid cohesion protein SCC4 n=1 Tax=Vanilla planifolia TaxID=51239 RepID=A0A835PJC0_VANPL|nr:hypothetical protein HPP92_024263 [Vanilla planifolia]KAG0456096.1 hypothetical protein HPP92_023884 [Vanilla planifolia]
MDAVAEGLWILADDSERRRDFGAAVKCLEALCQSGASLLPLVEIRTRLRLASLLLSHSHNLKHAKSHLERALLLLQSTPAALPLKFRAHSLLSRCYDRTGNVAKQKQILIRALTLLRSADPSALPPSAALLWSCNFQSQFASALAIEADYPAALKALAEGFSAATELRVPELQMFFASSSLHIHLFHWDDPGTVEAAARQSDELWASFTPDMKERCRGLLFYNELLQTFFLLRVCDYKGATQRVDKLDAAMKADQKQLSLVQGLVEQLNSVNQGLEQLNSQRRSNTALREKQELLQEQLRAATGIDATEEMLGFEEKIPLAPPPLDGEWLPRSAVYALVDLVVVMMGRPKGVFKECGKRIQSGMNLIREELRKIGIGDNQREMDIQHSDIFIASQYLLLLMQFLENKVAIELTRSDFVEAQEAILQMKSWFIRFPTMLQGCESIIEMLRGQYAHSVACFPEASFHFLEATKLTKSKSMQSMCQIYAAVSYICNGDAESSSLALDLVGPVYKIMDSFVGVREKTCIVFAYGLLLMRQHNLQEARSRLASGLKIAHQQLGNIQLVSQYLTILGALALQLHDTEQAREILKSSLTLAKTLYDVPTQIWVLSVLTDLYKELGERKNEMDNSEYEQKKEDDLQKRLFEAHSRAHHIELIEKVRFQVQPHHGIDIRQVAGEPTNVDLDIPESIGLKAPMTSSVSRLIDINSVKRRKKRI